MSEREARLGAQAEQLLDSQMFKDVWEALEAKYFEAWLSSRIEDGDHREHLWRLRLNMAALKSELDKLVRDGKAAAFDIEAKEKAATVRRMNVVPA